MTTQAQHSYDQALADKDTAIRSAQALANQWQAVADAQRIENDMLTRALAETRAMVAALEAQVAGDV